MCIPYQLLLANRDPGLLARIGKEGLPAEAECLEKLSREAHLLAVDLPAHDPLSVGIRSFTQGAEVIGRPGKAVQLASE
ncbi:MAG TPA: hypothetical protein VMV52_10970 [Candidatus Nanopelagicaceae bacterium]|nr:hypothetical protein [Candidatus Nanopelagicaceae bacterium]